ncbi:hypothetical protein [Komagataeibacter saccharivorans]|uniref:hypothetical protein n=1 Tax=Komagataeibacter saccharivorans TaxID=265959 RepID=UPI0039EB2020
MASLEDQLAGWKRKAQWEEAEKHREAMDAGMLRMALDELVRDLPIEKKEELSKRWEDYAHEVEKKLPDMKILSLWQDNMMDNLIESCRSVAKSIRESKPSTETK